MIIDSIKNKAFYENAYPLLAEAFAFVEEYNKNPLPAGKYELRGTDLFAMVQEYNTRTEGVFEAHDKYIDLQYVASGEEKMVYASRAELAEKTPYNPDIEAAFYENGDRDVSMVFRAGDFAVFYPQDAHKPGQAVGESAPVTKIVVKIRVRA
ncbi:MAG: YhcH/YjgK/YiaL family protein [Clostridia bacterium]|nr:YhcH/YjgK/YiaL family protein [Clostridia bacterium]